MPMLAWKLLLLVNSIKGST